MQNLRLELDQRQQSSHLLYHSFPLLMNKLHPYSTVVTTNGTTDPLLSKVFLVARFSQRSLMPLSVLGSHLGYQTAFSYLLFSPLGCDKFQMTLMVLISTSQVFYTVYFIVVHWYCHNKVLYCGHFKQQIYFISRGWDAQN